MRREMKGHMMENNKILTAYHCCNFNITFYNIDFLLIYTGENFFTSTVMLSPISLRKVVTCSAAVSLSQSASLSQVSMMEKCSPPSS